MGSLEGDDLELAGGPRTIEPELSLVIDACAPCTSARPLALSPSTFARLPWRLMYSTIPARIVAWFSGVVGSTSSSSRSMVPSDSSSSLSTSTSTAFEAVKQARSRIVGFRPPFISMFENSASKNFVQNVS